MFIQDVIDVQVEAVPTEDVVGAGIKDGPGRNIIAHLLKHAEHGGRTAWIFSRLISYVSHTKENAGALEHGLPKMVIQQCIRGAVGYIADASGKRVAQAHRSDTRENREILCQSTDGLKFETVVALIGQKVLRLSATSYIKRVRCH